MVWFRAGGRPPTRAKGQPTTNFGSPSAQCTAASCSEPLLQAYSNALPPLALPAQAMIPSGTCTHPRGQNKHATKLALPRISTLLGSFPLFGTSFLHSMPRPPAHQQHHKNSINRRVRCNWPSVYTIFLLFLADLTAQVRNRPNDEYTRFLQTTQCERVS